MFSSLAVPNYRIYFTGATVSNLGQWMARTAQSWLVLVILTDNSARALGYVTALMFLPSLLLAPVAGPLADRFPKRNVMRTAMSILLVDAVILSTLVLTGHVQLWHVYLIVFIDGVAGALDAPARLAFVSEVVPLKNLQNAVSLNSASFNGARMLGPGIGGLLIAAFGVGPVIAINIVSFTIVITALSILKPDQLTPAPTTSGRGRLREGVNYVRHRPDLLILLGCGLAVGGLGFNFTISHAVMATTEFGLGPGQYGALGSLLGVGAVSAALISASRAQARLRYILGGMAGYTVFNLLAAFSPNYLLYALIQVPVGLATMLPIISCNTSLQTRTQPEMRGRVMALWSLVITGMAPIVSPIVGWTGDFFGPRATVLFGVIFVGLATVALTIAVLRNARLRITLDTNSGFPWLRLAPILTHEVNPPLR